MLRTPLPISTCTTMHVNTVFECMAIFSGIDSVLMGVYILNGNTSAVKASP